MPIGSVIFDRGLCSEGV